MLRMLSTQDVTAIKWLRYCLYGVKHQSINQSISWLIDQLRKFNVEDSRLMFRYMYLENHKLINNEAYIYTHNIHIYRHHALFLNLLWLHTGENPNFWLSSFIFILKYIDYSALNVSPYHTMHLEHTVHN